MFNFEVRGPSPATTVVATPSITFSAGETSKSVTVGSLAPGSYEVTELSTPGFAPVSSPQAVAINLPDCSGSVTFESSCCTTATRIPTSPPTARPPSGS
jgi:hypothetical protein